MNKNHKRQVDSAHKAFAKAKRGLGEFPTLVGHKLRLSKHSKVARSAAEISRRLS